MNRWLKVVMCLLLLCAGWSLVRVAEADLGRAHMLVSGVVSGEATNLLPYNPQRQVDELLRDRPLLLLEAILSPTPAPSIGVVRRLQNVGGGGTQFEQYTFRNQPFNGINRVCLIQQQTAPYLPRHSSQYYIFALRRIRI